MYVCVYVCVSVCVRVHKYISLPVCLQAIQSDDVFWRGIPFWAESVLFLPLYNAHNVAHTAQEINNICLGGEERGGGHKKFLENILPPLTLALHILPSFPPSPTIRNSPTGPELLGSSGDVHRRFAIHAAGMQRPGMQMSWGGDIFSWESHVLRHAVYVFPLWLWSWWSCEILAWHLLQPQFSLYCRQFWRLIIFAGILKCYFRWWVILNPFNLIAQIVLAHSVELQLRIRHRLLHESFALAPWLGIQLEQGQLDTLEMHF